MQKNNADVDSRSSGAVQKNVLNDRTDNTGRKSMEIIEDERYTVDSI